MKKVNYVELINDASGYKIRRNELARQAFIRKSYSSENGGNNNELLEFYGDKALDYIVNIYLHQEYDTVDFSGLTGLKTEGELTKLKASLVNKNNLAKRIENLGLYKYLLMGKGDIKLNKEREASVREDLFEAIVGAIAIDCRFNNEILYEPVLELLNPNEILTQNNINYIEEIQKYNQKYLGELPEYLYGVSDNDIYLCTLKIIEARPEVAIGLKNGSYSRGNCDFIKASGCGKSKQKARMDCAKNAYLALNKLGLIGKSFDEAREDEVKSILDGRRFDCYNTAIYNKLVTKNLIKKARFEYEFNAEWECRAYMDGKFDHYYGSGDSKNEAKNMAIEDLLDDLSNQIYDKEYEPSYNYLSPMSHVVDEESLQYDLNNTDYISLANELHMRREGSPLKIKLEDYYGSFMAIISVPNINDPELYEELGLCYDMDSVFKGIGSTEYQAKNAAAREYWRAAKELNGDFDFGVEDDGISDEDLPF